MNSVWPLISSVCDSSQRSSRVFLWWKSLWCAHVYSDPAARLNVSVYSKQAGCLAACAAFCRPLLISSWELWELEVWVKSENSCISTRSAWVCKMWHTWSLTRTREETITTARLTDSNSITCIIMLSETVESMLWCKIMTRHTINVYNTPLNNILFELWLPGQKPRH